MHHDIKKMKVKNTSQARTE